jgi:hypothetical protein
MTDYVIGIEVLRDGTWRETGPRIAVDAVTPQYAVSRVDSPGVLDGVTYRVTLTGKGGYIIITPPIIAPACASLPGFRSLDPWPSDTVS